MALVTTMLILFAAITVLMLGLVSTGGPGNSGIMSMTNGGISMASARTNSTIAFDNAESGVELTLQWLHDQSSPPANTTAFALTGWGFDNSTVTGHSKVTIGSGCCTIIVYPDPGNNGAIIQRYMIESAGFSGAIGASGTMESVVHAYVQQNSFGKYAFFIDSAPSNIWYVGGVTQFDGPVHSNNDNGSGVASKSYEDNILWYDNAGTTKQTFLYTGNDAYSCSAPGANWADDNTGNLVAPSTSANWYSIAAGGQSTVQYGTDFIPMPTNSNLQSTAALGTATAPSTTGVLVPNSGGATTNGIYIKGNVSNMTLSVNSSYPTNQIITIAQTDSSGKALTTVVTLNAVANGTSGAAANTTTVAVTSAATGRTTTTTYSGLTNGCIYCTGSIGSDGNNPGQGLSGVIANNVVSGTTVSHYNALTIATDKSTSGNQAICLNGSLTCYTPAMTGTTYNTASSSFQLNAGILGLASYNIDLQKYTSTGAINRNVEIDAATLATGTTSADGWSDSSIMGTFYQIGSYIAGTRGAFGGIDSNGNLVSGYTHYHHYDQRLANTPPPYFDTTGNQYDIVSWQVGGPSSIMS